MKRLFLLLIAILAIPTLALAADFRSGDSVSISSKQVIERDLYIASGTGTVDGVVRGDLFIAGGTVRVTGKVEGDLFVAGGSVTVSGEVTESLRGVGGSITVSGRIGDNLAVGGGEVSIEKGAKIAGDVDVGAGTLTIAGATGPVQAGVGELHITSTASINGALSYTSDEKAEVADGATITGQTTHRTPPKQDRSGSGGVLFLLTLLVFALIFQWVMPRKAAVLASDFRGRLGWNLLYGLAFLVLVPISAILLLVTVIGWPAALIVTATYFIMWFLAALALAISLGHWLLHFRKPAEGEGAEGPDWGSTILGLIVIALVSLVPIAGGILLFLLWLVALGALVRFDWQLFRKLRSDKTL